MSMRLCKVRYSADSDVPCRWSPQLRRQVADQSQERCFGDSLGQRGSWSAWSRSQSNFLAEDLVHHLGAPSKSRHDLMPVYQLCRGDLVVPGEQRNRLDRHAMGG